MFARCNAGSSATDNIFNSGDYYNGIYLDPHA
jgi:hypothetical protein